MKLKEFIKELSSMTKQPGIEDLEVLVNTNPYGIASIKEAAFAINIEDDKDNPGFSKFASILIMPKIDVKT